MTTLDALILGFIQGVCEFLPISSSAHLSLTKYLLGHDIHEKSIVFDLFCHLGTILALLLYLRSDFIQFLKSRDHIKWIVVALIPLLPLYILLSPFKTYLNNLFLSGICLLITGIFLFLCSRPRIHSAPPQKVALYVGISQAFALFPGISRSGFTISIARFLGWSPEKAVEFSFFLAIPTICGGTFLEGIKFFHSSSTIPWTECLLGFFTSFLVGFFIVRWTLPLLKKGYLKPFAWYCVIMGLIISSFFYG